MAVADSEHAQQTQPQISPEKKMNVSVEDEPPPLVKVVSRQSLDAAQTQAVPKFLLVEFSQVRKSDGSVFVFHVFHVVTQVLSFRLVESSNL